MSDEATLRSVLWDAERLEVLRQTGLLDTPAEEEFDRLTRLVCRLLGVPAALVSLVQTDRQFFKSAIGLPEPWLLRRETSLLHSFCQHVVTGGAPLLVQDATRHPLVAENLAVSDLGVIAYLGMPLTTSDGHVIGALCAIDTEPRTWLPGDAAALRDLATMTIAEATLRRLARAMDERMVGEAAARETERAGVRRLESLRRLASSMAHEFAGLMQSVQSGVRLATARIKEDPAAAQSLLALVADVARRGGLMTDRLRLFVAHAERRPQAVDVGKLLHRLVRAECSRRAPDIQTSLAIEDGLPHVLVDPDELQAVLTVLVSAACSAMAEGGVLALKAELELVAAPGLHRAALRPGSYVRVSVADSGTGVDGQWADAAGPGACSSNPAERLPAPEIALALDLAEQIGGALTREREPGIGATFLLWLPTVGDPEQPPRS
jgi:signal transduction histidine kinase